MYFARAFGKHYTRHVVSEEMLCLGDLIVVADPFENSAAVVAELPFGSKPAYRGKAQNVVVAIHKPKQVIETEYGRIFIYPSFIRNEETQEDYTVGCRAAFQVKGADHLIMPTDPRNVREECRESYTAKFFAKAEQ